MERINPPSERPFVSFMTKRDLNNGLKIIATGSLAAGVSMALGNEARYLAIPGAITMLGGMTYPIITPFYRGIREQIKWNKNHPTNSSK